MAKFIYSDAKIGNELLWNALFAEWQAKYVQMQQSLFIKGLKL
jgi:hypothetical protein